MGDILAQTIHAAGASSPGSLPQNTHAVALQVADEEALLRVSSRLDEGGIEHVLIREPDEPYHGAATAIGCRPVLREVLRPYLKRLALFR